MHAGILTSEFEGMPRCVLETLAVGRPVVAMHLPQLEAVIQDGESGFLVQRSNAQDDDADNLARKLLTTYDLIAGRRMYPDLIASHIDDFTPRTQLARVFQFHHDIQDAKRATVR
jgi:glycosyltransferase involved in cell wall biosynthesis